MSMSDAEKSLFEMPHAEFESRAVEALDRDPRDYGWLALMQDVAYRRATREYRTTDEQAPFMQTWSMLDVELMAAPARDTA